MQVLGDQSCLSQSLVPQEDFAMRWAEKGAALALVWHILLVSLVKQITPNYGIDNICNHRGSSSPCPLCLKLLCKLSH